MFLKNQWYVAAWSNEIEGTPLARRIAGEPVVLYRTQGGQAVAFDSRKCSDAPNDAQTRGQQPITGNTQGVVGIPNLKLSTEPNPTQGSLLSSEKNNVKLDSGTVLLLRVNQQ